MAHAAGIGARLGGYRLEARVADSATGTLYLGRREPDDPLVWIDVLSGELSATPGLFDQLQEARTRANRLNNPFVAEVKEVGKTDRTIFVATECLGEEGVSLATRMEGETTLELREAVELILRVAAALDAAHSARLIHGALEPRRIEALGGSGSSRLLVSGFSAPDGRSNHSPAQTWAGPPPAAYAAPEQISGEPSSVRSDVYALGCLLYELATGRTPFAGANLNVTLAAHLGADAVPPSSLQPDLPPGLDDVIRRALAKRPSERFASAGEMGLAALEASGGAQPSEPAGAPDPGDRSTVISAWERSLAAGADLWSPSAAAQGAIGGKVREPPSDGRRGRSLSLRARWGIGLAVAVAAATAVIIATSLNAPREEASPAPAPAPSPPPAGRPAPAAPPAQAGWPDRDGYTVIVSVSRNDAGGAAAAADRARRMGFDSGVLDSDDHPSLSPGRVVTFVGVFGSRAAARREATRVRRRGLATSPYVRFVDRRRGG